MAPALDVKSSAASSSENKKAIKDLEELMGQLSLAKDQPSINDAAHNLATFINGNIEEKDAPTQYVIECFLEFGPSLIFYFPGLSSC
jgi:elongation factor 3